MGPYCPIGSGFGRGESDYSCVMVVVLTMAVVIPVVVTVDEDVVFCGALTGTRRITLLIVVGISMVVWMVDQLVIKLLFLRVG